MRIDLHIINMLHQQVVGCISKFRMGMKFQFQQQSKMVEDNFFIFYLSNFDSESKSKGFDSEKHRSIIM